ncbi:MAG: App1 family protein [Candidatus Rokubacteria bacterium]|nr:App1 family protein [Candidatus Rokubacteria bacterium]
MQRESFPRGSFNLRQFRLKDGSGVKFLENRTLEYKLGVIEALLRRFPDRHFVLVGDSGEKDTEVYARLASRFPNQVRKILIRDVGGEGLSEPLFVNLRPEDTRRVLRDPHELADFNPQELLLR